MTMQVQCIDLCMPEKNMHRKLEDYTTFNVADIYSMLFISLFITKACSKYSQ